MKFVNFNQFRKDGNWVNTWKAWNKQYLQSLNAKITSLQDYIIYNSPEYMVFNSPYNENPINITERSNPLQEDVNYAGGTISLFYPARLSWRQGFYNQSAYGDGILMYKKENNLYQSYKHISMSTIQHYIFQKKEDVVTPIDTNLLNYSLYVLLPSSTKTGTYTDQFTSSEFIYHSETDEYIAERLIFIGESVAENIKISDIEGPGDNWEYSYDTTTGFLKITNTRPMEKPVSSISFSFDYNITISESGLKRLWHNGNSENFTGAIDTYIHPETFTCVQYLLNPLYLIHHSNIDYYEAIGFLQYNTTNNTLQIEQIVPKGLVYLDTDSNPVINQTSDITLTTSLPSSLNQFADFPSGYVCILNKQPIGIDNETNSIKKSLDSYLIAPIGNGAYYTLDFFGSDLIAKYTENDLNNFINQIRINLGQNLRYFLKGPIYLMGVNSLDKKGGAFALSNIGIDDNEIIDIITDHCGNLWTGGNELVAQTVHYNTKEEVFIDVTYDTYVSQLKRNLVHNFNISTTEDIADIEVTDQKIISMIQLQLF